MSTCPLSHYSGVPGRASGMSTCPLSHCSGVPGRAPGMSTCPLSHCSGVSGRALASADYTPDTPHTDEELEPIEASKTRTASLSDSTLPLSPDHPQPTQTSPTPTLSRPCYYRSKTRLYTGI
ncbi:hypothetical protein Tco_1040270 [Tanacetum coccineum]